MRIKFYFYLLICILGFSFSSCFHEDSFDNTNKGNFEALWNIMDQHYCFFHYKGVDWNAVYKKYAPKITETMSRDSLFHTLGEMLNEVKDGHVNLVSSFDMSRYWAWFNEYPANFDIYIQANYLGDDFRIAGGLKYRILPDINIGYIYYSSFSNNIGNANIYQALSYFANCHGVIIDIRNNGGGLLSNSTLLSSYFFTQKTLVGYMMHKKGKGHDDFSKPSEMYITPSKYLICALPVAVLTNRSCFSAANDFVNAMRYSPYVTIVGDRTGGGGGLPFSYELPNGWMVRLSVSPTLDAAKEHIELGIDPDVNVDMADDGVDDIIEKAKSLIEQEYFGGKIFKKNR